MDREEIFRYIKVGSTKSICVDRQLLEKYPGIVRNVIIRDNTRLQIDFLDTYDYEIDEGEFTLYLYYDDFDKMFQAIEQYLGLKMKAWKNFNKTNWFPTVEKVNSKESWEKLTIDFINKSLYLPCGFKELMIPSLYWKGLVTVKPDINHAKELFQYLKDQ